MTIMSRLTNRQKEVALLKAQGKQYKQIASELNLSVHTVKTYMQRAKDRSGCTSTIEMSTRCAIEASQQGILIF